MGALDRVFRGRRGGQERPVAAIVAGLWKNGEQGVWYDSSDLSTMYQDAAGTLPVYMPGSGQVDPLVGRMLDKRFGLSRGTEQLTNGNFSNGSTGWTTSGTDATHVVTFSGAGLRYQSDTLAPAMYVRQSTNLVVGRLYELTFTISSWASGTLKSEAFTPINIPIAAGMGTFKTLLTAASTGFSFMRGSPDVDMTISSISVREVLGNHCYQATTTSRPTLSARYNVLTSTESLADTPWTVNGTCVRTGAFATSPAGTLTAARIQLGTLATDEVKQTFSTPAGAGVGYTAAIWLKSNTGSDQQVRLKNTHINVVDNFLTVTVTPVWQRFSLTVANGASAGTGQLLGIANTAGGLPKDILAWGADLRIANDGVGLPPYQRVVDANTYDTVGFPLYLRFDGADDFLQTASVDFTGTNSLLALGAIRKLSDAARGVVVETSTVYSSFDGTFVLLSPGDSGIASIAFNAKGTTLPAALSAITHSAPISLIVSVVCGIAAPSRALRFNGTQVLDSSVSMGAGNFGNHPMYIGRRAGTSLPFNGRLYSLLLRGAATPDATIAKVERHLNDKARIY